MWGQIIPETAADFIPNGATSSTASLYGPYKPQPNAVLSREDAYRSRRSLPRFHVPYLAIIYLHLLFICLMRVESSPTGKKCLSCREQQLSTIMKSIRITNTLKYSWKYWKGTLEVLHTRVLSVGTAILAHMTGSQELTPNPRSGSLPLSSIQLRKQPACPKRVETQREEEASSNKWIIAI